MEKQSVGSFRQLGMVVEQKKRKRKKEKKKRKKHAYLLNCLLLQRRNGFDF